jgi:hypothetical protein
VRLRKATEIVIGVLYGMGAVHQAVYVLPESREFYVSMAAQAWLRPAQVFIEELLVPNSAVVTILVVVFEATLAVAILSRGGAVRAALLAGGVFSIVGALTGSPAETVGFGLLAVIHFRLARARGETSGPAESDS